MGSDLNHNKENRMFGRAAWSGLGLVLVLTFAGCHESTSPKEARDGAVDGPSADRPLPSTDRPLPSADRPFPGTEAGDTSEGGEAGSGDVGGLDRAGDVGGLGGDVGGLDGVGDAGGLGTGDVADTGAGEVASDATDAPSASDRNAACGVPGTVVKPANLAGFLSYLLGSWVYCTGYHMFGRPYDGIEFVADGTWYFLDSDGKDGFVRRAGFDAGGTWSVLANNNFQLNLDLFGGGGDALFSAFQVNPMAMRAMNSMGSVGDYVKLSTQPSVDGGGDQ